MCKPQKSRLCTRLQKNANENSEEVFLFFEISRRADEQELDDIAALISDVLKDVASAVGDFHAMSETLQSFD